MPLIRMLIGLLLAVFSLVAANAQPLGWERVDHPGEVRHLTVQPSNVAFAARAPPKTADNVGIAGASPVGTGGVRVLYGVAHLDDISAFWRSSIVPTGGASNIATAQRLADDLRLSSARSPFTPDGRLAPSAIQEGRQIIRAEDLGNPNIPAGYGKYESPTFQSPSGDFKVHYYYNPVTQDVVYDLDYKVIFNHQGNWP